MEERAAFAAAVSDWRKGDGPVVIERAAAAAEEMRAAQPTQSSDPFAFALSAPTDGEADDDMESRVLTRVCAAVGGDIGHRKKQLNKMI